MPSARPWALDGAGVAGWGVPDRPWNVSEYLTRVTRYPDPAVWIECPQEASITKQIEVIERAWNAGAVTPLAGVPFAEKKKRTPGLRQGSRWSVNAVSLQSGRTILQKKGGACSRI